ncbi:hypothetical protein ACOCEA_13690 [Maribacter sp. CXY002]|uniref:hypothetical protein n=1 Tax=Maribacter luteocoastalis TaxID=3407671 RepID=UPI003B681F09
MMHFFENPSKVLYLVLCFSSICSIITTLEWFALRDEFKSSGYYSWEILRFKVSKNKKLNKVLNVIFKYPNFLAIFLLQLIFSIAIFFLSDSRVILGISALCVSICYFLISYRRVDGFNGGDSMAKIVFLTSSICFLSNSPVVVELGLIFISFQLILAYTTPGLLRIFDSNWTNGKKLMYVLRMETFSKKSVYEFFSKHPILTKFTSISIIIFEAFFVFSIFLPIKFLLAFLLIGSFFHLMNAMIMGLNTFVWSFVGSYPAIIWTSLLVREIITGANIV